MGETFYSVLGVDPGADTETIRRAYREKVKTCHPDVSDADDAARTFQRITEARDVLVDGSARDRYDRIGHDAYLRRHLDSSAWSVAGSGRGHDARSADRDRAGGGRPSDDSADGSSRTGSSGTAEGAADHRRGRAGASAESGREYGNPFTRDDGDRAWTDASGTRADANADVDGAASTAATEAGPTGATAAGSGGRARADGWANRHAASNVYSPSGREAGVAGPTSPETAARIARRVGPWFAFHFVFLASAFVTVWLLVTWIPSLPTMFVSLVLLGCAVFFSILHMVSRVYS